MHRRSQNDTHLQPKNRHYKEDVYYALQMCQWLLKGLGAWPPLRYRANSILQQFVAILLMATCFSVLLFLVLPVSYYMFFVEKNVGMKVKLLGPVSFCLSSMIKYCYLGLKGAVFERCIQHVEKDWREVQDANHRTIMLKYVTISRNLITLCAVFLYSGGMSYHAVMPFLSKGGNEKNVTVKPLAYPCYDSFIDTQSSPTYELVFCVHCFAAIIMYSIKTAGYSFAAIFVTHICGQIQIQISRLENLLEQTDKNSDRDPLTIVVHDHVRVIRFSKNVEEALREICLTEIIECTLNMCFLEYYCLTEWQNSDTIAILTYFTLLISFTFNIFIFCYIGEVLSEQCSQIGAASYEIEWYNLPARKAYHLILLNTLSQFPPKLTAGKIIELSLNTFSTVVKTSIVYLNLLRTVTT